MAVLLARYRVRDRDAFRRVFDAFEPTRAGLGVRGHRLLQDADDPALVVALFELSTAEAARAYAADPQRREALERAGVVDAHDLVLIDDDG